MDTRRISTADTRLANNYDVIDDRKERMIVTQRSTNARKMLFRIDLRSVMGEERKWAVIDYINEYKGIHLLPCMTSLGESFRDGNAFYVAHALTDDVTLRQELMTSQSKGVQLDEESIRTWMRQILMALCSLHVRKVVHGAVTSSNVFVVGSNDQVRLGPSDEFLRMTRSAHDLQQQISSVRNPRTVTPTSRDVTSQFRENEESMECLEHLAPESFNATGNVDPSNDIWALGVMTYKLTTGNAPFSGQTPVHFAQAIQKQDPDWRAMQRRGYSDKLIAIVKNMLQKEPAKRMTAQHLLNHQYFRDVINSNA